MLLLGASGVGGLPSAFKQAPDTPVPAEPTPSWATPPPDPCEGQPCLNGGSCSARAPGPEVGAYVCTCASGFTGHNCEFFADPCASSPCLHGNCIRSAEEASYTCKCGDGYEGEQCDQPILDQPASNWEPATPPGPEQTMPTTDTPPGPEEATPTTSTPPGPEQATPSATARPPQLPTTSAAKQPPHTLPPWQPKPGQRLLVVPWEKEQVTAGLRCVSPELCELEPSGILTLSLEMPEETAVKIVVNVSIAPVLWHVGEEGFQRSSVLEGSIVWFQQASDGLVIPERSLPLGQNYFLSVLQVGPPNGPEVTLRLNLTVKASSCVEPGSRFSDPQCSGKGKCVTQPSASTFFCDCEEGYSGIFCEEFDACNPRPCHNNATCSDLRQGDDGRNFTCTCPPGYQGSVCDQRVDPCASAPCHNNGSCSSLGPGLGYRCVCAAGFTGPACTRLLDFCALNPCAHGVCRSVGTSYRCLCVPGYHGLYCEEEYNECLSAPCQNYATCRDLINAYECVCTAQYEGRHCEIYRDPCLKVFCQNGGRCESTGLNVSCVCLPGYRGESCEVDVNECEGSPCHHGGTCIDQSNGFVCHCPPGWVGANCEIHLQWKPAHPEDTLTNMPRHSLYIIIGALCVAFVLMLIILIVGICRISRIEYQGSSRHAYQEFYNCRSIDSEFSNAIASIRHARFGRKSRPAMYDATPITYEDYSPDDKPLVTLIKTKDL